MTKGFWTKRRTEGSGYRGSDLHVSVVIDKRERQTEVQVRQNKECFG